MNDFEKQINKQIEIHKRELQEELEHLCFLREKLNIDSKSKLEDILEFVDLFNKLANDGILFKK